jgi:hypothetical protein
METARASKAKQAYRNKLSQAQVQGLKAGELSFPHRPVYVLVTLSEAPKVTTRPKCETIALADGDGEAASDLEGEVLTLSSRRGILIPVRMDGWMRIAAVRSADICLAMSGISRSAWCGQQKEDERQTEGR